MSSYIRIKSNGACMEVVPYEGGDSEFFGHVKKNISADIVELVNLGCPKPGKQLYMLVDEDGYLKYQQDPTKANRLGTVIHNNGNLVRPHFILGDVVLCGEKTNQDGERDLAPLDDDLAKAVVAHITDIGFVEKAKTLQVPASLPSPHFSVRTFDTLDEMLAAMK